MSMPREKREIQKEDIMPLDVYIEKRRELRKSIVDYKKINLPLKQIDKKENFRRIIDLKNNSGWIHISQLKKSNSVIAMKDKVLFKKPTSFAKPVAQIKEGRLLILEKCEKNWCRITSEKFEGWIKTDNIWGLN